ncbi:MAG: GMC family oxidoreductase [Candidatus Aminicenantes bacterium]|nr:GMC family oxidoreductase [Candidatus Aminicenantes bacterium]
MYDAVIVGTGASAAAAALELQDKNLLILDVGLKPHKNIDLKENIFALREKDNDQYNYLIGENFESLANIEAADLVSVKLKAPYVSYVINDSARYLKIESENFFPYISFAYGGLANAWGAGAYIYTDYDLRDFPIKNADLEPFYEKLTEHIGVSGKDDDLTPFFGSCKYLQKELNPGLNARHLLQSYQKRKKYFRERGITIGRSRLAVLTEEKNGRKSCDYENTGYFSCNIPYIYTPTVTFDRLKTKSNITLLDGFLVETFAEQANAVTIKAKEIKTGKTVLFKGKKLLLAAGTIGTAKIVLSSFNDYAACLPILDNPFSVTPFVDLRAVGSPVDRCGYEGVLLNLIYEGPLFPHRVQGSISSYISPLRGDVFFDFPLSIKGNLVCTRQLLPALAVLLLFYPDFPGENNYLKLLDKDTLHIHYTDTAQYGAVEKHIIRSFYRAGFVSAPFLSRFMPPGKSIHYAGTIPMCREERKYFVNRDCRLERTAHVHIIDGSVFPVLPAKNLTFTLMANAMRAAHKIKKEL